MVPFSCKTEFKQMLAIQLLLNLVKIEVQILFRVGESVIINYFTVLPEDNPNLL